MQYYFDLRDGDEFERDEVGAEFSDDEVAKHMATQYLLALAKDAVESGPDRVVSYEVRDAMGRDIFKISLSFGMSEPTLDIMHMNPALPLTKRH